MAIDFRKYTNDEDKIALLEEIRDYLVNWQTYLYIKCGNHHIHVDPYGFESVTVDDGEREIKFKTVDDFFLNFIIDGKPLIERIDELEYDF